jgi:class 3 adenylate cyclase/tetratricopeptide (TPR) repeat protein
MSSPDFLRKLAAYVPMPVANAIYHRPMSLTGPTARRRPAVVLFTDISGFTPLSELLSQAGPTGAEELTHLINQYFTRMIEIIQAYHGQVVKFSGDALTVLFPAEDISMSLAVRRAGECALTMQANMSQFAKIKTSRGPALLSMKVGIGAGEVLECNIGGVFGRWEYVVGGDPLVQVAMAEHQAQPGQIILSPQAWAQAEPFFVGTPNGHSRGFVNLYKAINPLSKLVPVTLAWDELSPEQMQVAEQALECYVPYAVKARLDEPAEWLAELRRMTILFIGIGGIDYDAADAGERLQTFLQAAQEVTYQFEGSLSKVTVDDKGTVLLILFGAPPLFHEDDATRAVACALGLQTVAREQNLRMSIGMTEGPIFAGPVGAPTRREYTVLGDEVNLAARLMQYGRAESIVISERVKDRIGSQFVTESLGEISIKGKAAALPAYLVTGEQGTQDEFVTRYLLYEDLLIGRKAELEQIRRMTARTQAGKLQLLFIEGEPGLGKSRLAAEMVREWLMEGGVGYGSKCISYGRQIPYQAWREVLIAIFSLNPAQPPAQQLAQLQHGITDMPAPPEQPDYWLDRLPLLADVLGLDAPENDITQHLSGELRRNNTFALIEAILRHQVDRRPLLILLEDIHWADELSLALAAFIAKKLAESPLLLALVHRPMSEVELNSLANASVLPYAHTIQLEPLSAQESLHLVKIIWGEQPLPANVERLILSRGQGNPFFLHEITNTLLERVGPGQLQTFQLPETLDLPDTVQDVILSRVDRLTEAEKLTLKIASVIGASFQRSLLSKVHPMHDAGFVLPAQLDTLASKKLLRLEIPAPKWEYVFHNIMAQEVVYEGLLLAQRRQLHGTVGIALEDLSPDAVERLAFHYTRSDNWEKAIHYLKMAGQKAQREYANHAAIRYFTEILACLANRAAEENGTIITADYWDILMERARLYNLIGWRDETVEDLGTLGIMAEALDHDRRRALAAKQWANFYETCSDYDSGLELLERTVTLAQEAGDEKLLGEAYNHWGKLLYLRGQYEIAHAYLQRALRIAQNHQDKTAQADCLNNLGIVAHYQADYDVARYFFQEAMDLWDKMGDQIGLGSGLRNIGQLYYDTGQYAEAQAAYQRSLSLHRTIGDRAGEALTQHKMGQIQRSLGDYETARTLFEEGLVFYQSIGDHHRVAHCLYHLGFLHCRLAEYETALTLLDEAIAILREMNDPWALAKAMTYYGWTLMNQNRLSEARQIITETLKIERESQQEIALMEDMALLGRIALQQGDISLAETCTRHVLSFIERQGSQGIEHPALVYLTCYQTFAAGGESEQAERVLAQGRAYISAQADQIDDPALREKYLSNIPEISELQPLANEFPHSG